MSLAAPPSTLAAAPFVAQPGGQRGQFLRLTAPALTVILVQCLIAVLSVSLLCGIRAALEAAHRWSRARAEAVERLRDFAATRDPRDLQRFDLALKVPLGDRQARLELGRPNPDRALVRQGFLAGGVHPDDVGDLVRLYRCCSGLPAVRRAVSEWQRGEALILQLRETAHMLPEQASADPMLYKRTLEQLALTESELRDAEATVGEALSTLSRRTGQALVWTSLASGLLLAAVGLLVTRRLLRQQIADQRCIREAMESWELAAAAAQLGLFDWHLDDDLVRLDGKAAALFALPPGAGPVPREALRKLVVDKDRAAMRGQIEAAVRSGDVFSARFGVRLPGGATRCLELNGMARAGDGGPGGRLVGVVRDVTQEAEQAELRLQKEAAERVARARMDFLSRLSHELRTPLNAILGFAQLLELDTAPALADTHRAKLKLIAQAGAQLQRLVEDVLDLSRIDSGAVAIDLRRVDTRQVLDDSLALVQGLRERRGIHVECELPAGPMPVQADAGRLQQVFVNLLTNAFKYNREGGRVGIRARFDGDELEIAFEDEGPGMDAAQLAELFQPFKRVSMEASIEGTGMGLFIVRFLLERMGGRVEVRSQPGRGSAFTVRLKRAAGAAGDEPVPPGQA